MNDLVSIILPVYNGQAFLAPAIESVLAQTYSNWEMIIIDDGSTDSTPQVIDRYQDKRIVKLAQANSGGASARNAALAQARGGYIAFLDADDLYLPDALANLASFLADNPQFDVVFSNGYVIDEHDRRLSQLSDHRPGIFVGNILEPLILNADVITVPVCTLTRRALVDQSRAKFDPEFMISEDWDFWIQLAPHGQFGYLDRLTCAYRIHQTNKTRRTSWQQRRAEILRLQLKLLTSNWFDALSLNTRQLFAYRLLIDSLKHDVVQQRARLSSPPLSALPPAVQADLWRLVGSQHLALRSNSEFAADCYRTALRIFPADRKSKFLSFSLSRLGHWPTNLFIRLWRIFVAINRSIHRIGRPYPKPFPAGFGTFRE